MLVPDLSAPDSQLTVVLNGTPTWSRRNAGSSRSSLSTGANGFPWPFVVVTRWRHRHSTDVDLFVEPDPYRDFHWEHRRPSISPRP